jgi:hypothetical protein
MPMKRRGEKGPLLAWPELVDAITSRQVPFSFYVHAGRSCIYELEKRKRAQTNRVIGNGESESFDASRHFSLLTVAWTSDSVPSPLWRLGPSARYTAAITVPIIHMVFPHSSDSFLLSVTVCPAGLISDYQKTSTAMVTMTFRQKDVNEP